MFAVAAGFALSISLIFAIGAQNAFVLRHGLRGQHVFWICLTCAVSDAILITAGVAGLGAVITRLAWLEQWIRWGGAAFVAWYGLRSWRAALRGGEALEADEARARPLWPTLLMLLAVTWLNPHVYLDTVLLLGSLSTQYDPRWQFGVGAIAGSTLFFFSLGYGARLLAPWFAKPVAWRILDGLIGAVMLTIAVSLVA